MNSHEQHHSSTSTSSQSHTLTIASGSTWTTRVEDLLTYRSSRSLAISVRPQRSNVTGRNRYAVVVTGFLTLVPTVPLDATGGRTVLKINRLEADLKLRQSRLSDSLSSDPGLRPAEQKPIPLMMNTFLNGTMPERRQLPTSKYSTITSRVILSSILAALPSHKPRTFNIQATTLLQNPIIHYGDVK